MATSIKKILLIFLLILSIFSLNTLVLTFYLDSPSQPVPEDLKSPKDLISQFLPIEEQQDSTFDFLSSNTSESSEAPRTDQTSTTSIFYPRPQIQQFFSLSTPGYKPLSYGLSNFEASNHFTNPQRKQCTSHNLIKKLSGSLKASCGTGQMKVFDNSNLFPEKMGKSGLSFDFSPLENGSVLRNDSEFYFVKCEQGRFDALLLNRKKESSAKETRRTVESLKEKYSTSQFRPLTVIFFVIDSASRNLVFRNIPETMKLFNEINSKNDSNYLVYDFLLNNAIKTYTVPNMISFHLGISIDTHEAQFKDKDIDKSQGMFNDWQKQKSLWSHFKQLGFITAMSSDGVGEILSTIFGRTALVDHQVSNFWKFSNQYFGLDEFKDPDVCIGPQPPHWHTLSYINQMMKNYQGFNKFIFAHINTAHESTGTRLKIADNDFVEFFKGFLKDFKTNNEDLVFLFGGDHGTSKADFVTVEGLAERVLTSQFMIANKELVERFSADLKIMTNTKRLVSRYDWHKTLKVLAYAPYTMIDVKSQEYLNIKTELESVSIFHEIVNENRDCIKAGIYEPWCLSKEFLNVKKENWPQGQVNYFVDNSISKINFFLNNKFNCEVVTLDKVVKVESLLFDKSNPDNSNYLIHFKVKNNEEGYFLAYGTKADRNKYHNLKLQAPFLTSKRLPYLKDKKTFYSVEMLWKVIRLGPLLSPSDLLRTGKCENILKFSHGLYLSNIGQKCSDLCKNIGMDCRKPNFYQATLEYISGLVSQTERIGEFDSLELIGNTLVVGRLEFCQNQPAENGICYCSMTNKDPWHRISYQNNEFSLE